MNEMVHKKCLAQRPAHKNGLINISISLIQTDWKHKKIALSVPTSPLKCTKSFIVFCKIHNSLRGRWVLTPRFLRLMSDAHHGLNEWENGKNWQPNKWILKYTAFQRRYLENTRLIYDSPGLPVGPLVRKREIIALNNWACL